ncbi:hypothetical protein GCM10010327_11570 [Streptomyces nitrosporeus]|nr:hypothetical protein GCM10010327_11570 [Streptomyces nitrosporeus]
MLVRSGADRPWHHAETLLRLSPAALTQAAQLPGSRSSAFFPNWFSFRPNALRAVRYV